MKEEISWKSLVPPPRELNLAISISRFFNIINTSQDSYSPSFCHQEEKHFLMLELAGFFLPLFSFFIQSTYSSANGLQIGYTSWLSHGSLPDQFCGYQELGLICVDGYPIFSLPPGLHYRVTNIDYGNHTLHLFDFDTFYQTCPRPLHNVPLANLPFSHSPLNLNLSSHNNCSSHPSDASPIRCLTSGVNESFVFVMGNKSSGGFDWSKTCEESVTVMGYSDHVTSAVLMNVYKEAMNEGFALDWQTACDECEASDGLCGCSNAEKEFLCFCKDGSVQSKSCSERDRVLSSDGSPKMRSTSSVYESLVSVVGNETGGFDKKEHVTSERFVNGYEEAIYEGSVLDWETAESCDECEASNGLCGCSNDGKEFLCFYKDGSIQRKSRSGTRRVISSGMDEFLVFVVVGNETGCFDWSSNYEEGDIFMGMKDEIISAGLMGDYEAMDEGFVLDQQRVCDECEASDGLCAYSNAEKEFLCSCKDGSVQSKSCSGRRRVLLSKLIIGLIAAGLGALLICIIIFFSRRKISLIISADFWKMRKNDEDIESFIRNNGPLTVKRYTFSEIRKMTNSFEVKLGEGGYGNVYKGSEANNLPVAVKVLKASEGDGEEFINEVLSISRTSHVNIVTLLGFCLEGSKKALVYELMPNGSLEKFISKRDLEPNYQPLSWEKLLQIAEGIAKGLEYLHGGCNTRIVHFDIKPHNILLDENFCPKISDFGLAKLCSKTHSNVSMLGARGTVGYIAPEVWNRNFGRVSHKSDVYSYGMLILKMIEGSENIKREMSDSSDTYLPYLVYKQIEVDKNVTEHEDMSREESEIAKKMMVVGLWCVQTMPSDRPPMNRVIEMLAGSLEQLSIPPKPSIFSPITARNIGGENCATNGVLSFSANYQCGR